MGFTMAKFSQILLYHMYGTGFIKETYNSNVKQIPFFKCEFTVHAKELESEHISRVTK